jgi:tetratricopeptide (TPR) repeat protein
MKRARRTRQSSTRLTIETLQSSNPAVRMTLCLEQLQQATEMAPDFPPRAEDLGSVLTQQRKPTEAIPHFEQAIQQDPGVAESYNKLGLALAAVRR